MMRKIRKVVQNDTAKFQVITGNYRIKRNIY